MTAAPKIQLSGNRRALFQALLKNRPANGAIGRRRERGAAPVSLAQEQIWHLHQLDPTGTAYHIITPFRLRGEIDPARLDRHLRTIRARHEVLRTIFSVASDGVVQKICEPDELGSVLDWIDLRGRQIEDTAAQQILLHHAEAPFDLARGPVFRAALIQIEEQVFLGHITLHHIVSDGWSSGVLLRELALLEQGSQLPELPLQYGDFAAWQRDSLASGQFDDQLSFWRSTLQDAPALLNLPVDHPRSRARNTAGGLETALISSPMIRALAVLGEQEGATLFMTLLAAYAVLLSRYTGQNDIVLGTPVANRNRMETEPLIGLFMNILPIRIRTSGQPSFRALIGRVRESARAAYANQDAPFGKLVELLRPDRSGGSAPLAQAMFVFQNTPPGATQPGGLQLEPLALGRRSAKNDLTLYAEEAAGGLSVAFEYDANLFESETVRQMLHGLEQLLRSAADSPDTPISELPVMAAADWSKVVRGANETARSWRSSAAVHQLIGAQVLQSPEAVAIRFQGQALTYRELEEESGRVARFLRKRGAGRDVLVAICMERSLDMLIALLAVLKTGAAYVPLDPAYPAERIGMALDDSRARLLLTQSWIRDRMPPTTAEVIEMDRPCREAPAGERLDSSVEPGDLAYVIFTSGSTGRPKGVQVTHGAVVNFLRSMAREPGLGKGDILAAVTTLSFDIAGLELFLPLAVGGTIELISHDDARDGIRLAAKLRECGATCVQATPATWRMLMEAGWQGHDGLKILCGGEALPADLASELLKRSSELWNMYGPTETTIWSTVERVRRNFQLPIRIGRPIANTECYILDHNLEPAPAGVTGQLYIGGDGVARGYLNGPELTAEKFLPDPFRRSGARLYSTGDLARRLHDGSIECLGRADHQVKVRGFRIELGEIEECLMLHPGVTRAAVIATGSDKGERQLIAYVVPAATVEDGEWNAFLRMRLPDYMLPAAYVQLPAMPLTPNGKVDRRALPAPDPCALHSARPFTAPQNDAEHRLASIFAELLGIERVGRDDHFFDLGGHSLLVTRLLIHIRAEFGCELSARDIFQAPSVAEIASRIAGTALPSVESDFDREAALDADIRPNWTEPDEDRGPRILLTGATGFLGMFLLRDLLEQTRAEVVCLVRGDSDAHARHRLQQKLIDSGLWKADDTDRLTVVAADLARPLLGLAPAVFETLAASVTSIYHNGASVNFSKPYPLLKPANVDGTIEIARLACQGRRKAVHYVSTISVLSASVPAGLALTEDAPLGPVPRDAGGYPQSKWVAERLMREAAARGLPVSIYRPGTITGDRVSGICNPDDFLYRFLRGCAEMGSAPEMEMQVDLLPVDYISGAIVKLSLVEQSGGTYHLAGTQLTPIRQVYEWVRSFGLELTAEPYGAWRGKLMKAVRRPDHPLAPLAGFFPEIAEGAIPVLPVDSARTQEALARAGVSCPPPEESLLHLYLKRLLLQGSLTAR